MKELIPPPRLLPQPTNQSEADAHRSPFTLYSNVGDVCGQFTSIDLAVRCLRVLRNCCKHVPFNPSLVDRFGCPVQLPESPSTTQEVE